MSSPKPVRLQRKRTKGFHLESPNGLPNVYVGRPTKWGNWVRVGEMVTTSSDEDGFLIEETHPLTQQECFDFYKRLVDGFCWYREDAVKELRGKNLVCFCGLDELCHADILLEIANG